MGSRTAVVSGKFCDSSELGSGVAVAASNGCVAQGCIAMVTRASSAAANRSGVCVRECVSSTVWVAMLAMWEDHRAEHTVARTPFLHAPCLLGQWHAGHMCDSAGTIH